MWPKKRKFWLTYILKKERFFLAKQTTTFKGQLFNSLTHNISVTFSFYKKMFILSVV